MTEEEESGFISFCQNLDQAIANERIDERALLEMREKLNRLEQIQLEEAQYQMMKIAQATAGQELMFYLETAILVILLFIVQLLIITDRGIKKLVDKTNFNLN